MEQSLVALPGRARLVGVDARNDQDAVGNLLLHLLQTADIVHDGVLVVCAAGTDVRMKRSSFPVKMSRIS